MNYFSSLRSDKVFEVSAVELSDFPTIVACIYRSPDRDFYEFLSKLEVLITKVYSKGKCLILCGDLNINFLQHNGKLHDLQNLLLMNSLTNVVKSPTRITSHTKSLIDVIIVNNSNEEKLIEILDMLYSDHLAQFLCMKLKKLPKGSIMTYTRHFTDTNVEEFKHLMHEETLNEGVEYNEPNTSFKLFMNTFTYYFNAAFPLK